jgi:predicted HD phosphohydrolase
MLETIETIMIDRFQAAALAEQAGQSEEVILGAFLHDFGRDFFLFER